MATLTYSDIETRVMNRLRLPTSNTTEATKVRHLVNDVYREVASQREWWWLLDRQVINTADDITTGTISVTAASTSATLSSAPTPSVAGRVLLITADTRDSGAIYRISTHTAGATALTLDAAFTGATAATASYAIYQDTYDLALEVGEVLSVKRYGHPWPVEPIGPQEMHDIKIYDRTTGKPEVFSVFNFATSGDPTTARSLVVHPYPDNTYRLEVHYRQALNTEVSGTTRFFIPDDYLHVLEYLTLGRAYPIFLNDPERGLLFEQLGTRELNKMAAVQIEKYEDHPQITPRDDYRRQYRGRRLHPARMNLGSFFDRWPISR